MASKPASLSPEDFVRELEAAEQQAADYGKFLTKFKGRLSRAKKALAAKPDTAHQVSTLVSDLQALAPEPEAPEVLSLIRSLESLLKKLRHQLQESFPNELRQGCEAARLHFAMLSDGFAVGPFLMTVNHKKETASFSYAKTDVAKGIPLGMKSIINEATSSRDSLLDPLVDFAKFASELDEAMRVAQVRQNKTLRAGLRVGLPAIYREMKLVRESSTSSRRAVKRDYLLARFVVELKAFLQSDHNMHAERKFGLETAVIENTKNSKKSIFIPSDLSCGFGEGTYYQALILR